jgi:uncharacterized protein YbjT (DUF2867 family)
VARCLIIGCGCRGLELAGVLRGRGHAVRGTTRDPARRAALQAAGVEPFVGDPDRVSTIAPAFAHSGVACVLLGSARGGEEHLRALHGTRLEMLLERMLDTTVRGIVYEATGTVDAAILAAGAERVRRACERSLIPHAVLDHGAGVPGPWAATTADAVERVLLS